KEIGRNRSIFAPSRRQTKMLCGHRAHAGARSCGRRWHRLAWQKHDVIESRIRDVVFPSGNFDVAGVCAGHRGKKLLRTMHALHQQVTTPSPAKTTGAGAPTPTAAPRRRKSRRRRYILIGIGALILLWIVGAVIASKREKPIPVTTEKAAKRTILQLVSATGKVQPETEVKISPEVAGEIIELPVIDGAQVNKGDLLVKVRPDSYKALLEQQEAAISAAKATNLQQKATMMKTEQDLKRADDMYSKKTISIQEYNTAQAAYDVAKNTFESSLHEIERAQAGSSQARDQLSKTTIYSPIDGTVTILNSKLGERIVATN